MNRQAWLIICLTYCGSLFLAGLLGFPASNITGLRWIIYLLIIVTLTLIATFTIPRFFYRLPQGKFWLAMGLIAILAVGYLQLRLPHPSNNDISQILSEKQPYAEVILIGKTRTSPQETPSQKLQIWLKAESVTLKSQSFTKTVTGKVYVTLPYSSETEIYPNQKIRIKGTLYQPRQPTNSYGFNFQQYLERQGSFAGIKGEAFELIGKPSWGWWMIRKRIVESQKAWIPKEAASLMSSIVLGRRAVNLAYHLKELFIHAGMAHIVAASGFHVSLLLGIVLYFTRYWSPQKQLMAGVIILTGYIGLTGGYPSVLRASLMGIGVLIGATVDRKKDSINALLLTVTLLLIWNPLWLGDLGFRLSFLATFGLLVTLPALQNYFDFLPPRIATFVTIPLAASLWTFPLLNYTFGVLIVYSIPLNIIAAPLVYIISLGGMISAVAALIIPPLGSAIAGLLYYPIHWLITLVTFTVNLPGNYQVIGTRSLGIILIIYGLFILTWLHHSFRKRWPLIGLFVITLFLITPIYNYLFLTQVTLLPAKPQPMMIIQDRGKATLLNYGNDSTNKYTLMPFLSQQGIAKIDCIVSLGNFPYYSPNCLNNNQLPIEILENSPNTITSELIPFKDYQILSIGSTKLQLINNDPRLLQMRIKHKIWLWILKSHSALKDIDLNLQPFPDILLWSGERLSYPTLKQLDGKTAIALSYFISNNKRSFFKKQNIELYSLRNDGSIQWTSRNGLTPYLENDVNRDF